MGVMPKCEEVLEFPVQAALQSYEGAGYPRAVRRIICFKDANESVTRKAKDWFPIACKSCENHDIALIQSILGRVRSWGLPLQYLQLQFESPGRTKWLQEHVATYVGDTKVEGALLLCDLMPGHEETKPLLLPYKEPTKETLFLFQQAQVDPKRIEPTALIYQHHGAATVQDLLDNSCILKPDDDFTIGVKPLTNSAHVPEVPGEMTLELEFQYLILPWAGPRPE